VQGVLADRALIYVEVGQIAEVALVETPVGFAVGGQWFGDQWRDA
jgi:hypothetical protein